MMDKNEQEALSTRYAYRASVTPLEDGSFAVFALDLTAESLIIVDNPDDLVIAIMSRAAMSKRITPSKREPQEVMEFDDVDFSKA